MPRGATVVDFAYAIHSDDRRPHRCQPASNGEQAPLAHAELKNGDVVEVLTEPMATPNPAWSGFACDRAERVARFATIRQTMAHTESEDLGEKIAAPALRRRRHRATPQMPRN